jgi:hypothetical protein
MIIIHANQPTSEDGGILSSKTLPATALDAMLKETIQDNSIALIARAVGGTSLTNPSTRIDSLSITASTSVLNMLILTCCHAQLAASHHQ